jgi:hypothetical protein
MREHRVDISESLLSTKASHEPSLIYIYMQSLSCSKSEQKSKEGIPSREHILCEEPSADASNRLTEVRGVEDDGHGETTDGTSNGNGHDPGEDEETNTLPVDGLDGSVAKADTDGRTSDTHGGGDGKGVLREDQDGESGTHLHRATWDELVCEISRWSVNRTYLCWESGR